MHNGWLEFIEHHERLPYFDQLRRFVESERAHHVVHPAAGEVFSAFHLTPLSATKVVIVGQDPYHGPGQAHGLAFSVRRPVPPPPSLRNIFTERRNDLGLLPPRHGDLSAWAQRGVLLLNTTLTVREGEAASHTGHGWETFTDAAVVHIDHLPERVVFVLWGRHAREKRLLLTGRHHVVIESAHPSPLSARHGFFGSSPFSRANEALVAAGREPVDWSLPD